MLGKHSRIVVIFQILVFYFENVCKCTFVTNPISQFFPIEVIQALFSQISNKCKKIRVGNDFRWELERLSQCSIVVSWHYSSVHIFYLTFRKLLFLYFVWTSFSPCVFDLQSMWTMQISKFGLEFIMNEWTHQYILNKRLINSMKLNYKIQTTKIQPKWITTKKILYVHMHMKTGYKKPNQYFGGINTRNVFHSNVVSSIGISNKNPKYHHFE